MLILHGETNMNKDDAQKRANWERSARMGKAFELTYVVQGWIGNGGELWAPNTSVEVSDDLLDIDSSDPMLVISCTYRIDENGTTTTLLLQPPEAMEAEPKADTKKGTKKHTKKSKETGVKYHGEAV